jgi:hypothetical protein
MAPPNSSVAEDFGPEISAIRNTMDGVARGAESASQTYFACLELLQREARNRTCAILVEALLLPHRTAFELRNADCYAGVSCGYFSLSVEPIILKLFLQELLKTEEKTINEKKAAVSKKEKRKEREVKRRVELRNLELTANLAPGKKLINNLNLFNLFIDCCAIPFRCSDEWSAMSSE